jgi:hypothetical protein
MQEALIRTRQFPAFVLLSLCAAGIACTADSPTAPTRLVPGSRAAAAGTNRFSVPFTFDIPAGTCGLTTNVHGSGEYQFVETTHAGTSDGTRVVGISNIRAHGSATGADGTRYSFTYVNNLRVFDAPPGDFSASFVDSFHLIGQGSAPDIGLTVQNTFTVFEDGSFTFSLVQRNGDFSCDPI